MIHDYSEMTRGAFVSYMRDYVKQLLSDPTTAKVDDFLLQHNITNKDALELLLNKPDPNDDFSAVLLKVSKIKDNGYDDNGKHLPDSFSVTYKSPRKNFLRKIKKIYNTLYENAHIVNDKIGVEKLMNEEGEGGMSGGATSSDSSGQYTTPLFGKPIKRTIYVTQEQIDLLKEALTTNDGYTYDVPLSVDKNDPTMDHSDIMKKSWQGEVEENINIKPENKGKFTQTKKRTGKSTEELTHSKNPLTRKRAIFAQNAKKWNHNK